MKEILDTIRKRFTTRNKDFVTSNCSPKSLFIRALTKLTKVENVPRRSESEKGSEV